MKRVVQIIVQQLFWMSCISVALLIFAIPSLITGPF